MGQIKKELFVCLDCESTGLDEKNDKIIEIAAAIFTFDGIIKTFETLVDPQRPIPELSQSIHNISDQMVAGKPKIKQVLPELLSFIEGHIIIGHKIGFDLSLIDNEAARSNLSPKLCSKKSIDTLRLARLYGQCPTNSLESLRKHFNIPSEGPHRAMSDVIINIDVFKHLTTPFKTTESLITRLEKPIKLKTMPLGKHKGRRFEEIPIEYLYWAAKKDFDEDLLYSIRTEIKTRKTGNKFEQAINPFSSL